MHELTYACELVELARAIGGFSIGVASHPIGHPRSPSMEADRDRLAEKLRMADFSVTQFFFDVEDYVRLVDDLVARDLDKPVLPGIIPVTTLTSVPRMAQMGGPVPPWMVARLEDADAAGGADEVRRVGIDIATELCQKLLDEGAPGLHFYTLNQSTATREIYANLGLGPASAAAAS